MSRLLALHDYLTDIGYIAAACLLTGIGVLYCLEAFLRYALNAPTLWSVEMVTYLMLATIFLALPHVTRSGAHIAVTIVMDLYPRLGARLQRAFHALGAALCGTLAWIAFEESHRQYAEGVETLVNYPIPKWWVSAWIVFGLGSACLWYLRLMLGDGPARPRMRILQAAPDAGTGAAP